ncbi:MAG: hypothetical protein JW735_03545, partial [Prolixibacteraceae bacterium]|nr:hypothetical protein [Prolixibacteraceae bacterium]
MVHYLKIAILMLVLFLGFGVFAQVPQRISYQAVIRDNSGNLVISDDVSLRITIQSKTTIGGAISDLYTETHSVTTNENGLVTLFIGGGTPVLGTFDAIVWTNNKSTRRLKVEVDPTGGTSYVLVGTSDISSTPYALLAKEALTVSNESDPDFNASPASQITTTDVDNWNSISLDDAYDNGRIILVDNGPFELFGNDGAVFRGEFGMGNNLTAFSSGTRMFWFPKKSAFRVGTVIGDKWNESNLGNYSIAFGYNTMASGIYSTAMGSGAFASGVSSIAMGTSEASGEYATAMGSGEASGDYAVAMGSLTEATLNAALATGYKTKSNGLASTAMGNETTADGDAST